MKIRYTTVSVIDNQELIDAGIDLMDRDAIIDFFFDNGGPDEFESHGETLEVTSD